MKSSHYKYTGKDIAVLVPTKDRPEHIKELLNSLICQTEPVGRIIIVASGIDIADTISAYSKKLHIEYCYSQESGQIRQRNIGIGKLDDRSPLVACIDDDIVLDSHAIKEMIKFWNNAPVNTGGVGFNINNDHIERTSFMRGIFFLSSRKPGRVLLSGCNTPISNLKDNIRSQWLNGGSAVWQKDVLINNRHKEINTKWAIGEDLIFSYPLGKKFPLYVCANATVRHNHDNHPKNNKWYYFYGNTQTLWVYYFVRSNKELSKVLFFLTLFMRVFGKLIYGISLGKLDSINFSIGSIAAIWKIVRHALGLSAKKDIRED